jgi:hypothetical protein
MRRSALLPLSALLAAMAVPAVAQDPAMPVSTCGEQKHVTTYLRDTFEEVPVSLGLQADGRMLQIFASEATGSWTIVSTTANGTSCIVAVGEAWQVLPTGPLAEILEGSKPHPRG